MVVLALLLLSATALLFFLFIPRFRGVADGSLAEKCGSNMRQIGVAILLYQQDHGQNYPNTLDELMEEQFTAVVFICPESSDIASTGATTQAIAAGVRPLKLNVNTGTITATQPSTSP